MSTTLIVAVGVTVWFALAAAAAIPTGKALHRAGHRQGLADPVDCPPWCLRERAAALLRNQRRES